MTDIEELLLEIEDWEEALEISINAVKTQEEIINDKIRRLNELKKYVNQNRVILERKKQELEKFV